MKIPGCEIRLRRGWLCLTWTGDGITGISSKLNPSQAMRLAATLQRWALRTTEKRRLSRKVKR